LIAGIIRITETLSNRMYDFDILIRPHFSWCIMSHHAVYCLHRPQAGTTAC